MLRKKTVPPKAYKTINSLRETGYDINLAIADIIDNSISAEATKIYVYINLDQSTNEPKIYIADNGYGMNEQELEIAMTYGGDSAVTDSYLNKFGFGLKTGSTAFCRKLSLLSKKKDDKYCKATWDLDHISKVQDWELLFPDIDQDEVDLLETITKGGSGTLVIWENVDRLFNTTNSDKNTINRAYKRVVDGLRFHLSMVFQRFIDSSFNARHCEIYVNDEILEPWDPFFLKEPETKIVAEKKQEVILDSGEKKYFYVKAVVLPRPEDWSSKEAKKSAKVSNPYAGIYVYRENRLIHYGDWLGMFVAESHVALLRVEFSFDHELDDLFNVDIKKSRILLNEAIYDFLKTKFLPTPRQEAIKVYNSAAAKKALNNAAKNGFHKLSNTTIDEKKEEIISSSVEILNKVTGEVNISNHNGTSKGILKILDVPETLETKVVVEEKDDDLILWEPGLVNKEHAVIINSRHPFYYKVYAKAENTNELTAIDFLLWSLSEAEMSTYTESVKEQYKDMRIQVSSKLRKLVEVLPEPENIN